MVDIRLIEYIRKYSSAGYSNQQIGETLLQSGYSQETIREAFMAASNQNAAPIQNRQPVNPTNIYQKGQNPYPQNYNQYDYHDNSSNNSSTQSTKKTVSLKVAMIVIVILLLILGGIYVLVSKDSPDSGSSGGSSYYEDPAVIDETGGDSAATEEDQKETTVKLAELNGDEEFTISLCSEIQTDFSCAIRPDNKYTSDEAISYVHIYKAKTVEVNGGYRIGYSVRREVYDESGNYVARLSSEGFPIIRGYPIETEVENKFGQQIFAKDFETPGKYTLKFIVTDRYTFEEIIKEQNIVIV